MRFPILFIFASMYVQANVLWEQKLIDMVQTCYIGVGRIDYFKELIASEACARCTDYMKLDESELSHI